MITPIYLLCLYPTTNMQTYTHIHESAHTHKHIHTNSILLPLNHCLIGISLVGDLVEQGRKDILEERTT